MHSLSPRPFVVVFLVTMLTTSTFGDGLAKAGPTFVAPDGFVASPSPGGSVAPVEPTAVYRFAGRPASVQVNPSGIPLPGSVSGASQTQAQAPVTLSPSAGPPGTRVAASWPGSGPICILIYAGPAQAFWDGTLPLAQSNDRGTVCEPINLSFTVPANAAPGPHQVRITGTTSPLFATFTVTGGAAVPPGETPPPPPFSTQPSPPPTPFSPVVAPPSPPAPPLPPPAPPSCPIPAAGDLWRAPDGRVFAYLDDAIHWVPDLETFQAWGFAWGNVRDVPAGCLVGLSLGHPLAGPSEATPVGDVMMEMPEVPETEPGAEESESEGESATMTPSTFTASPPEAAPPAEEDFW